MHYTGQTLRLDTTQIHGNIFNEIMCYGGAPVDQLVNRSARRKPLFDLLAVRADMSIYRSAICHN